MFQLVERPALFPGRPLLEAVNGPFIDTGIEMELGGRVYIDRTSAAEIARLMPPKELTTLRETVRQQAATIDAQNAELDRLRTLADAVRSAVPA